MNGLVALEHEVEILPSGVKREDIQRFEQKLSKVPGAKFGDMEECPLTHEFADGVYVRTIFIPKGMIIVGKIHRHAHPNFLMKGEVSVVTESGGIQRLKAPIAMISPAGTKRVVFTHEDTVWSTVHVTEETDLAKIEEVVIAKTYEEFESQNQLSTERLVGLLLETIKEV
jgi:hypothetical protein